MSSELRLVNLDCPSCGSAMHGEGSDTIFFCSHCGGGAVLGEAGLQTVESTALLPAPGRHPERWLPAWRVEVRFRVRRRVTADGRSTPDWDGERVFFIPAFDLALDDLTRLSRALSEVSELTSEVPREPVHGGTLAFEDAMTLIRHVLVGDEVRRSDMLASVEIEIDEVNRGLVALPFTAEENRLRCAVTGVTVNTRE